MLHRHRFFLSFFFPIFAAWNFFVDRQTVHSDMNNFIEKKIFEYSGK